MWYGVANRALFFEMDYNTLMGLLCGLENYAFRYLLLVLYEKYDDDDDNVLSYVFIVQDAIHIWRLLSLITVISKRTGM